MSPLASWLLCLSDYQKFCCLFIMLIFKLPALSFFLLSSLFAEKPYSLPDLVDALPEFPNCLFFLILRQWILLCLSFYHIGILSLSFWFIWGTRFTKIYLMSTFPCCLFILDNETVPFSYSVETSLWLTLLDYLRQ